MKISSGILTDLFDLWVAEKALPDRPGPKVHLGPGIPAFQWSLRTGFIPTAGYAGC